ncbi:MAG: transglutaminase domain-containing protein [Cyclobacteriaceae bacterium]
MTEPMCLHKIILIIVLGGWHTLLFAQDYSITDYRKADSIAGQYAGHSLEHPAQLALKLTEDLPADRQKFRALYTWVCTNIKNDYRLYDRNRRKRLKYRDQPEKPQRWHREFARIVSERLREDRSTLCTGYAYIMRELAGYVGIKARIINGYGRTAHTNVKDEAYVNHSWNAVLLDGAWYLCDPTWSGGYIQDGRFMPQYDDVYFLADPHLFILNHYPADPAWTLLDEAPPLEKFLHGPVSYKEAYAFRFMPQDQTYAQKKTPWTLSFQATAGYEDDITLTISKGSGRIIVYPDVSYENGRYVVTHTFGTKGRYDVHLTMADSVIATYPVQVYANRFRSF